MNSEIVTSSLDLGATTGDSPFIGMTEDSDVYASNTSVSSSRGRSNLQNMIESSFNSERSYKLGTSEGALYGCYATESSIPHTSNVQDVCFPACRDGVKTKDHGSCRTGVWVYINGKLLRENDIDSKDVVLILDQKMKIPREVVHKLHKHGARRVEIWIRKTEGCIEKVFWKVINLEKSKDDKDEGGNGYFLLIALLILIIIIFLIGVALYSKRSQ